MTVLQTSIATYNRRLFELVTVLSALPTAIKNEPGAVVRTTNVLHFSANSHTLIVHLDYTLRSDLLSNRA